MKALDWCAILAGSERMRDRSNEYLMGRRRPRCPATIPDGLIAAAIADRGKAHPWETIPVARTALIVVDMQNYFVAPDAQGEAAPRATSFPRSTGWPASCADAAVASFGCRIRQLTRARSGRSVTNFSRPTKPRRVWRRWSSARKDPALADAGCPRRRYADGEEVLFGVHPRLLRSRRASRSSRN